MCHDKGLVTNDGEEGGGYKTGEGGGGGTIEVLPLVLPLRKKRGGGSENVLVMLKGGVLG